MLAHARHNVITHAELQALGLTKSGIQHRVRTGRGGTYRIDVTAPRSIKPKPGIRLHRPLSLDALDTTIVDGIPITSVAQTLLDVAAPAYRLNIPKLVHEAIVPQLLDMRAVSEVPFTRSRLEEAGLAVFRAFGISKPGSNEWVRDGEKLVEVDFIWRDLGLIVELDGGRYRPGRRNARAGRRDHPRRHVWALKALTANAFGARVPCEQRPVAL